MYGKDVFKINPTGVLTLPKAAAATLEMSASQARIFDQDERLVVNKIIIKAPLQGWTPVAPQSSVLRTCVLELPRDHATIKCSTWDVLIGQFNN